MTKIRPFIPLLILLLAACGGNPTQTVSELPTLAQLPTETATHTPPPSTPITPSATHTPSDTWTPEPSVTFTVTPSATITDTPTATATSTPTITPTTPPPPDNEALLALIQLAAQATILPQNLIPPAVVPTIPGATAIPGSVPVTTSCAVPPSGGFATVFNSDPTLAQLIGCPVGTSTAMSSASQLYEHGGMFWLQGPPGYIYVLFGATGRYQRYDDTYNANTDPFSGGETPPNGLKEPVRGFGKVWRLNGDVRNGLGWATSDEGGGTSMVQLFDRGQMIFLPQRGEIITLIYDPGNVSGAWRAVAGSA
jgi:hypothetical protein